jgi:uncharacterized protein YndB with AHSA1/START domain
MAQIPPGTPCVVVERDLPHPPEKVWKALTQPHLMAEWLGRTGFNAAAGDRFTVRIEPLPDRTFDFDCEVIAVEPNRMLAYTWNSTTEPPGQGLRSTVTWTLTATATGTRLRMEQAGFRSVDSPYFVGAGAGWPRIMAQLERLLARPEGLRAQS